MRSKTPAWRKNPSGQRGAPSAEPRTGKSRREIDYRRQFAASFPTEELFNALNNGTSWREVAKSLKAEKDAADAPGIGNRLQVSSGLRLRVGPGIYRAPVPDPSRQVQATYTDYRWVQPIHVWLCLTGAWDVDQHPGLLIAWRRHHAEWEALVVSASATAPAHGSTPTITTSWYAAGHVREA